jgi:hypothetical protein
MQFTKLFNSILDSTIWQEPLQTKVVWITMLAMVDRGGEVHASIPGLAKRAGVTLQECESALECLHSPDKYSRTQEHEGRRVVEIDGGWALLNHSKYRALLSAEERREYNRLKQAQYRKEKSKPAPNLPPLGVNDMSLTVIDNVSNAHSTDAESEAEADGGGEKSTAAPLDFEKSTPEKANPKRMATFPQVMAFAKSQPMPISEECCEAFFDRMEAEGWITPNGFPLADWQPRFRSWITNWANNANRVRAK